MPKLLISREQAQKIEAKLPAGRSLDDIRLIHCSATVSEVALADMDSATQELLATDPATAGGPPLITNGKPTVMRVVAWMAHEGINKNRDSFLADDLGPAADAIRLPNVLPMDWNHSAFKSWMDEPKAIGIWYTAEKRWDPTAKGGTGAYGIMAQGMVWSWLFPDHATEMLAEQARNGKIDFSMACLPGSVTLATDANGQYAILNKPTFLTLSALDVSPADVDATGLGVEGSSDPDLETELGRRISGTPSKSAAPELPLAAARTSVAQMTEEDMEELQAQLAELKAQVATLTAAQEQLVVREAELQEANNTIEAQRNEITEVTTTRDAFVAELAAVNEILASTQAELAAANASLSEAAALEEATANTARYETRLSALPETYRTALEARSEEDQTRFRTKWTTAPDEAWAEFAAEILTAFESVRTSMVDRSRAEGGTLPTGGDDTGISSLVASIKR
jgi:hypothetical protein